MHRHRPRLRAAARRDRPLRRLGQRVRVHALRRLRGHPRDERLAGADPDHRRPASVIGALHGFFFAKIGVPAFVVTLAGFLGWNGLMLWLLGSSGTINIPADEGPVKLLGQSSFFMDQAIIGAYLLAGLGVLSMLVGSFGEQRRRKAAGVPFRPTSEIVLRVGALAVVVLRRRVRAEQLGRCVQRPGDLPRGAGDRGLRAPPYDVRPQGLRGRRRHRGGPQGRYQRADDPYHRVRHLRRVRGDRRSVLRRPDGERRR